MISNATAIICLSRINKLDLLKKIYSTILIPSAVKNEVLVEGREGYSNIYNAIQSDWIKVIDPKENMEFGLGAGETQAINLAIERKDEIILDDAVAVKVAKSLNISIIRTTTVIFTGLKNKIITNIQALAILNQLIEKGYYISTKYYSILLSKLDFRRF